MKTKKVIEKLLEIICFFTLYPIIIDEYNRLIKELEKEINKLNMEENNDKIKL